MLDKNIQFRSQLFITVILSDGVYTVIKLDPEKNKSTVNFANHRPSFISLCAVSLSLSLSLSVYTLIMIQIVHHSSSHGRFFAMF